MSDVSDFEPFADLYERQTEPLTAPFARRAYALAGLPPNAEIIDVAAGTGALSLAAARAGARGLATDLAPAMVARLAARLGPYEEFEAKVMDAAALDVADGRFDAAFSMFGVAIFPVWRRGFAELVRITRPGGRVVVGAWPNRIGAAPMLVVKEVFDRLFPDRDFWSDGLLTAWTRDGLGDALAAAGCRNVALHDITAIVVRPDLERMVDDALPIFRMVPGVKALADHELARLRDPLIDAFRAYGRPDGTVHLPVDAWIAVGTQAAD